MTPTARSQKAPRILPMSTVGSSINWIPKRDGYTRIQEYLYTNASRAHSTISCLALRRSAIILHHTHALTLTHTHTHSHARTHTHSRTHSHTLTCTLTHTHAHTHTHTHSKETAQHVDSDVEACWSMGDSKEQCSTPHLNTNLIPTDRGRGREEVLNATDRDPSRRRGCEEILFPT